MCEWFGFISDYCVVFVYCYWIDCWLKYLKCLLIDDEFMVDFKICYEFYCLCNFLFYKEEFYLFEFFICVVDFGRVC